MGEFAGMFNSNGKKYEEKIKESVFLSRMQEFFSYAFKVCLLFVIFFATLYYISNKAEISEQNLQNVALEKEIRDLEARVLELNVSISSQFSLEHISEYAASELDMIYPTAARVVSINSESYVSMAHPSSVYRSEIARAIASETKSND